MIIDMKRRFGMVILWMAVTFSIQAWGGLLLLPQSKLWLEGDSTLHRYSSNAEKIDFSAVVSSSGAMGFPQAVMGGMIRDLRVAVAVDGLKSGKSGLDKNLRGALKSEEYPEIVFLMTDYRLERESSLEKIIARGSLSVAGEEKPVEIKASLLWRDGRLLIEGEHLLLMTDFGIVPPKLMLGALRTDDRVVVKFHFELESR